MASPQHNDAIERFTALPPAAQSAFLQQMIDENLRNDPTRLLEAMRTITTKQTVLEAMATQGQSAQAEVKLALDRGESIETIKTKAASADNTTKAAVTTAVHEHQEGQKLAELAKSAELHQEKVGILAADSAKAVHPLAHLVSGDLKTAIGAAMGGPQSASDSEVSVAAGGKAGPQVQTGRG